MKTGIKVTQRRSQRRSCHLGEEVVPFGQFNPIAFSKIPSFRIPVQEEVVPFGQFNP
jgi:hypothetical protein